MPLISHLQEMREAYSVSPPSWLVIIPVKLPPFDELDEHGLDLESAKKAKHFNKYIG
jgi:hypothetical protein